jgi:hypothetical protein
MKNFLTVLSLSNLCFLSVWHAVIFPPFNGYHLSSPPAGVNVLALMADVLVLTGVIWAAFLIARAFNNSFLQASGRWVFLFLVVAVLNNIITEIFGAVSFRAIGSLVGRFAALSLMAVAIGSAIFILFRWRMRVFKLAQVFVLIMSPFILLTFSRAATRLIAGPFVIAKYEPSEAPATPDANAKRVVWIVFDEFEFRSAFPSRPASLRLPELDRLAKESFFAANAYPPAGATVRSLPALITGKIVADAREETPDTLQIRFSDSDRFVDWKKEPNIFSRIAESGGRSALVGWYHPYCRTIQNNLASCYDRVHLPDSLPDRHVGDLPGSMRDYFWRFGLIIPLVRDLLPKFKDFPPNENFDTNHIQVIADLRSRASEIVADRAFSFVFIHFPAPHPPFYCDRLTRKFNPQVKTNYFDNLALIDEIFGELRRKMEDAAVWNDTTVIVSADHWWRNRAWHEEGVWTGEEAAVAAENPDFRIPFIVKPAKGSSRTVYGPEFNTVLTGDLVMAISRGEVSTAGEIAAWIDDHRTIGKGDY